MISRKNVICQQREMLIFQRNLFFFRQKITVPASGDKNRLQKVFGALLTEKFPALIDQTVQCFRGGNNPLSDLFLLPGKIFSEITIRIFKEKKICINILTTAKLIFRKENGQLSLYAETRTGLFQKYTSVLQLFLQRILPAHYIKNQSLLTRQMIRIKGGKKR